MFILKKYSDPNLMLRNQNIRDFPYNLVCFFNIIGNNDMQFHKMVDIRFNWSYEFYFSL